MARAYKRRTREAELKYYNNNKDEINRKGREYSRLQKIKSVNYKGGACQMCGLVDDCLSIYDFHHTDPSIKEFKLSGKPFNKKELDKCIMVCANCHRKIHTRGD